MKDTKEESMGEEFKQAKDAAEESKEPVKVSAEQDLVDQLQRLQAEFENYKRRTDEENKRLLKFANEKFIKGLLPLVDSFGLALSHKDKPDECIKGVEMIYKNFSKVLEDEGLRAIECVGEKFDPYKHEVMLTEESEEEEDTILQELQKGYMLKELVLRHSKVKIAKPKQ